MPIFNLDNQDERFIFENEYPKSDAEKTAKTFEIKITGSGTKGEILSALWALARSIGSNEKFEGGTFEDETLCSEITEIED